MQEFDLIEKYFKPLTNKVSAAQNLNDDCAKILLKNDEELIISKDIIIEDVHFLRKDGGFKIASKLLLSNLSDIASSGAKPVYYMLGFCKNNSLEESFTKEFVRGLKTVQSQYKISLIGGDTTNSPDRLFFSVTIFAIAKKNTSLLRKNAKEGDIVFVTGDIGSAYVGLQINKNKIDLKKDNEHYLNAHFFPNPPVKFSQELVKNNFSKCAIDVSDGFLADLKHICDESNLDAVINTKQIPLYKENITAKIDLLDLISAGDDYQIIFTANKKDEKEIFNLSKKLKVKISKVGYLKKCVKKPQITLLDEENNKINFIKYGYEHR